MEVSHPAEDYIRHKTTAHIVVEFCECIHTAANVNESNAEMLSFRVQGRAAL